MGKFELEDAPRHGAGIEIKPVVGEWRKGDVLATMFATGFEATRYLTPDDLRELRDWIDAFLAEREVRAA